MKRILTVAGSDSGGGAGIQADLKTITVLGAYGMSALTALTAQNTVGVHAVHAVPIEFIRRQVEVVMADIGADAAKTGMLATPAIVETVAACLKRYHVRPLVVDPVMVAKSGDPLLNEDARETIKRVLLPLADVVTPNLPEAEVLCGFRVQNIVEMRQAARRIHEMGPAHVIVKGGHLEGRAVDLLFDGHAFETYDAPRLNQHNTHGTGCTFSAAVATFLGQGLAVRDAVSQAKKFITRAIGAGLDLGAGHGPTDPYAHIRVIKQREKVLYELGRALDRLAAQPLGGLIPEVRSNLVYALPGALNSGEVAGIPGRISQIGQRILVSREPVFGASLHMARVILAAMRYFPDMRAAINVRFSTRILEACRKAGLETAAFDHGQAPLSAKNQPDAHLEWGTRSALAGLKQAPDVVYDRGDVGMEPMVRVLGYNPHDVVDKLERIFTAW